MPSFAALLGARILFAALLLAGASTSLAQPQTYRDPTTGMEFVLVEGGCYRMGTTPGDPKGYPNENPQHDACVNDVWIGVFEVTQAQWQAVMGGNPSQFRGEDLPVERVSWFDAQDFIRALNAQSGANYRLPTEAEWEYAARGGRLGGAFSFAGSNRPRDVAWCQDNEGRRTRPVGAKQPNELGLYDMSGNVWEWCQDWYDPSYRDATRPDDPQGPLEGVYRVMRGGSFRSEPRMVKTTARYRGACYFRGSNIGFRLAFTREKVSS